MVYGKFVCWIKMAEKDFQLWMEAISGPGASIQESQKAYGKWARTYEQDAEKYRFNNHIKVAEILQDLFQENQRDKIRILDIGAGTGLVAKELKKYGFRHIDALEPSEAMADEARKFNLYENYFLEFITGSPSSISANTYDVLTGGGIYAKEAHVPCEAVHEMIRLVKPGGFVVLVANLDLIRASKNYTDLEPLMEKLEMEGKWKRVLRETWIARSVENKTIERIAWCFNVL
ncbi:uncharacterized protein LOC123561366 [Mercenaria mercenaria]|uniref:uncharacterized protein LOC123561366 n=1 Tax=Mercenaria mercenaria TaxID=6596 RepID=UPI00234E6BC3|nr:uncharacterized protein LOC123561366 [Mercenaria mercenaria]